MKTNKTHADALPSMTADKGQFDEMIRRMLAKQPQKTVEIKSPRTGPVHRKSTPQK